VWFSVWFSVVRDRRTRNVAYRGEDLITKPGRFFYSCLDQICGVHNLDFSVPLDIAHPMTIRRNVRNRYLGLRSTVLIDTICGPASKFLCHLGYSYPLSLSIVLFSVVRDRRTRNVAYRREDLITKPGRFQILLGSNLWCSQLTDFSVP